jgi:hypothetical protein
VPALAILTSWSAFVKQFARPERRHKINFTLRLWPIMLKSANKRGFAGGVRYREPAANDLMCKRGAAWKLSAGNYISLLSRVWCNKEGWNSRARALKAKCAAPRTSLGNVFCPVQVVDFGYEKSRFSLRRLVCRRPDQTGFKTTAGHHLNASAFFQQTPQTPDAATIKRRRIAPSFTFRWTKKY